MAPSFPSLNSLNQYNPFTQKGAGSFTQKGGNAMKFIKDNIWILSIIAIFIIISIICYFYLVAPQTNTQYNANLEHMKGPHKNSKQAELILFYVDWCPHCKTAKPEWEDLRNEYEGKTINGYTVLFKEVNCTNESAEIEKMVNQFKIEGYPTIKLVKDGEIIEYDAKPTKDTLVQFLNTVL